MDPRISFITSVASSESAAVLSRLSGTTIRLSIGPNTLRTLSGQVLTYHLATLVARLFDRVELSGEQCLVHQEFPMLTGTFIDSLQVVLRSLRPIEESPANSAIISVCIGSDALVRDGETTIFLGSTAWGVRVSMSDVQAVDDTRNPVGALAAATFGAAEVFKAVFQTDLQGALYSSAYSLSLLNYEPISGPEPELPDRIDLDLVQYGCGSIGCAVLLGLLMTPHLHGRVVIVDNGRFDKKNPYKYSLLDWRAASELLPKAVWASQLVKRFVGHRLEAQAFRGTAYHYVTTLAEDYTIPLAVSAVDSVEARFEIQDTLPRRIVNAGIDGTTVEVSVHGLGDGACLACVGMEAQLESWSAKEIGDRVGLPAARAHALIRGNEPLTVDDLAVIRQRATLRPDMLIDLDTFLGQPLLSLAQRALYAETTVTQPDGAQAKVTTAFVSAFAGVLILAELLKQLVPELAAHRVNNSYRQQMLGLPALGLFQHPRDHRGWCLCRSSYRLKVYHDKYGGAPGDAGMRGSV